jgi:DNA-directed RNA polymerase specialized sigma24 family protein
MVRDGSMLRLIQLLHSDDAAEREVAARLIWRRYFRDLLDLARTHLRERIQRRAEDDVLPGMYTSFCRRQERGEFDLAGRDALWRLLVTTALRQARSAAGRHRRGVRDLGREQTIPRGDAPASARWALEQMNSASPGSAEAAVLNAALERRLAALADRELRKIALWHLEGATTREIAGRLESTERSVERKLQRIRNQWISFGDD